MSDARLAALRTHHAEVLAAALAKQILGASCNFDAPQRSETLAPATRPSGGAGVDLEGALHGLDLDGLLARLEADPEHAEGLVSQASE